MSLSTILAFLVIHSGNPEMRNGSGVIIISSGVSGIFSTLGVLEGAEQVEEAVLGAKDGLGLLGAVLTLEPKLGLKCPKFPKLELD